MKKPTYVIMVKGDIIRYCYDRIDSNGIANGLWWCTDKINKEVLRLRKSGKMAYVEAL